MAKKKIGKIDIVNKALNIIPDTTEILSDTIKSTTPLVEKAMVKKEIWIGVLRVNNS